MAGLFDTVKNYYQQNVETPKRMYGESLVKGVLGIQSPQTEANFNPQELGVLKQFLDNVYKEKMAYFSRPKKELLAEANQLEKYAADAEKSILEEKKKNPKYETDLNPKTFLTKAQQLKDAANGNMPTDFSVSYPNFYQQGQDPKGRYPNTNIDWKNTLGQFRFKVDNSGNYQVYDTYDFENPSHRPAVEKYAAMNPISRLYNAIKDFSSNDSSLGEAYLGKTSVPVNINLPANLQYQDPFGNTIK